MMDYITKNKPHHNVLCLNVLSDSDEPQSSRRAAYFFLWRFLRRRFLRLWVAILWPLRFFPLGIGQLIINIIC